MSRRIPTPPTTGQASAYAGPRRRRARLTAASLPSLLLAATLLAIIAGGLVRPEAADARIATGGQGRFLSAIDWVEWGAPDEILSGTETQSTTTTINGVAFVFTCTLTSFAGATVRAYRPGGFGGDALDDLYNIGGTGGANQLISGIAVDAGANTATFDFDCSATLGGAAFALDGIVFADAEQSGTSEYVEGTVASSATWRIIDRLRTGGCTASSQATRMDVLGTTTLRLTGTSPLCATGPAAVAFADGAQSGSITVSSGGGRSAVALGAVVTFDRGDAPATYGEAAHAVQYPFAGGAPPVGGPTAVSDDAFALATTTQPTARLGPSVDPGGSASPTALGDDAATSGGAFGPDDDETDDPTTPIGVTPGTTHTQTGVSCTGPGTVAGWIDFNGDGDFDSPAERSQDATCGGASVDLTWTVPTDVRTQAQSFMRLRIAAAAADIATATGFAFTGEAEDHALRVNALIDLGIAKTAPAIVAPGAPISWTLTVHNFSLGTSAGFTVSDAIPPSVTGVTSPTPGCSVIVNQVTCVVATPLAPGGDFAITINGTAPPTFATPMPNTATVTGSDPDPNAINDSSTSASSTAGSADLSIVKSASPSPAVPGETVTYTLLVTNAGPTFAEDVSVSDPLPPGLTFVSASPGCTHASGTVTCTRASLLNGASASFDVVAAVASSVRGAIANTATVGSSTNDPTPANNTSTATVPAAPAADLSVAKSAAPSPAVPGQNVTYTVTVANAGPSDATAVSVRDALSAGLSFVSAGSGCSHASGTVTCTQATLASGASTSFQIVAAVSGSFVGSLANSAVVSSADPDPNAANNATSLTTPVVLLPRLQAADLEVVKFANRTAVDGNQPITWTIAVTNRGPQAASGVVAIDQPSLPVTFTRVSTTAGSCTQASPVRCALGAIASGATVTLTLTGRPRVAGSLVNTVRLSSESGDPVSSNDVASTTTVVRGALRVRKTADRTSVRAGGRIRYAIRVTNPSSIPVENVRVCDRLPSGLAFVSASPRATRSDGRYCWSLGTLAADASKTVRLVVRALRGTRGGRTNTATVTGRGARARSDASPAVNVLAAGVRGGGVTG